MVTLGFVLALIFIIIGLELMMARNNFIAGSSTLPPIEQVKRNLNNEKRGKLIFKIGAILLIGGILIMITALIGKW